MRPLLGDNADFTTFLGVAFPHDQVQILAYNRVVKDLGGRAPAEVVESMKRNFDITDGPAAPATRGEISAYFGGKWHTLRARSGVGASDPIGIAVDAREAPRRIFHIIETIPSVEGAITLAYPKWIPGEHSPAGPITDLVGLKISRDGRPVAWKRVPTDVWRFTCDVPSGQGPLEVAYDYVAPLTSQTTATSQLAILNWWSVILYPQGPNDDATMFAPSIRLPQGWKYAKMPGICNCCGQTRDFERYRLP